MGGRSATGFRVFLNSPDATPESSITRPEYVYRHRWQPNTLVFWDNRSVQHYAVHDYWPQRRKLERITIKGDRPFGPVAAADPGAVRSNKARPLFGDTATHSGHAPKDEPEA